ncbi:MAG: phosphatidylserine decarboxylase, partial [Candidatus Thiodiazotropha sp. (ex Ctena orbiculata)]|nr:phosphatidylserine decarboxylase [Candidatus Thiodiazotropha taylori]
PRDYHRLHMPLAGKLRKMVHVPGRLFSVNETTCRKVPRLFARNERVICLFDTEAGPMAMILVGAIFVSSIETVWAGTVTPANQRVSSWDYNQQQQPESVDLEKGEEMGRFNMGSTVILLFGKDAVEWSETFTPGSPVKMGRAIADLT